jgi:hypothetical protein
MSAQELKQLIGIIEEKLAALPPRPDPMQATYTEQIKASAAQREATEAILMDLARWQGAKFNGDRYGFDRMTLAGIKTSCTSGAHGLLTNWIAAARKRIAKLEGADA